MAELSPEERQRRQAFIQRFELESAPSVSEEEVEEERTVRKERRASRFFWGFIGTLVALPFILSAGLLYTLARYDSLIGSGGLEFLSKNLSSQEAQRLANDSGLPEIKTFVSIYDHRALIIALIFTFFFGLAAIIVLLRGLTITLRRRTNGN